MSTEQMSRRLQKKRCRPETIPQRFVPRFWDGSDGRIALIKAIRRRVERLKEDTGADSYQKEILAQRAIFLVCQLETMEVDAVQDGKFEPGVYTQMVNALSGLLSKLGLERRAMKAKTLTAYIKNGNK